MTDSPRSVIETETLRPPSLWAEIRKAVQIGAAIEQDNGGIPYEKFSAHLDEAARQLEAKWPAALSREQPVGQTSLLLELYAGITDRGHKFDCIAWDGLKNDKPMHNGCNCGYRKALEAVNALRLRSAQGVPQKPVIPSSAVLARGHMTTHGTTFCHTPLVGKDGMGGDGQPHELLYVDAAAVSLSEEDK